MSIDVLVTLLATIVRRILAKTLVVTRPIVFGRRESAGIRSS